MKTLTLSIVVFLKICQTAFSDIDCPILYHGMKGHSACIAPSNDYISGGVSKEDIKIILDEHNKARAAVNPPACNMYKMLFCYSGFWLGHNVSQCFHVVLNDTNFTLKAEQKPSYWHEELAKVAQSWAKQCIFSHDKVRGIPGNFGVGQNMGRGDSTWYKMVNLWTAEVKDFTHGSNNLLSKVGHYTQVVSEAALMIGCGYAECKKGGKLYVCDYGGIAGYAVNKPYEKCNQASPLIDCKGKYCKNSGSMRNGTCECKCENWKHIYGNDCSTNCSVKDAFPCNVDTFIEKNCHKYSNIIPRCPWMCHTCPYLIGKGGAVTCRYSEMSVLLPMIQFTVTWLLK